MIYRASMILVAALLAGCAAQATPDVSDANANPAATVADAQTVALEVPSMHCPFACWPKIRETLEQQPGVASVELAPQADPNAIDNPTVFVKYRGNFDSVQAIAALEEVGFDDAAVTVDE